MAQEKKTGWSFVRNPLLWVGSFILGALATWFLGFFNQFLPSPPRVVLAIENAIQSKPPPSAERFRFVLTWLRNDPAGTYTHEVEQNFYQIEGIELVRSECIVEASGAADEWQSPMQERAREILNEWNADVAIVGSARSSNEGIQLSLWFVSRAGTDTLGRQEPYALTVPLPEKFREDLGAQIAAVALSAAASAADNEARGQVLTDGLEAVVKRIGNLLASSTITASERRAALHVAHGAVLLTLGAREDGTERLEQAVTAYNAALEVYTRERVPLDWAVTQNNLGAVLWTLGEREDGTERLEQAVTAFTAALEVRTRQQVPLQWAATQNNLGAVLWTLGEREDGTERLEQAVTAFTAALEVRTRQRVRLDWAATQNNLGAALRTLGEREDGTERLEQAVTAFTAALEVRTRQRVRLDWAMTQNNLGAALATLGEREDGTERLEQAVTAFTAALEVYTREQVPLQWAATQNNLGNALRDPGGARGRDRAARTGRHRLHRRPRSATPASRCRYSGPLPRTTSAMPSGPWGSARTGPSGSNRPSPPTPPPSKCAPASGCRSTGP